MPTTLNTEAWHGLLRENIEWLLKQPRTLERDHIEDILRGLLTKKPSDVEGVKPRSPSLIGLTAKVREELAKLVAHHNFDVRLRFHGDLPSPPTCHAEANLYGTGATYRVAADHPDVMVLQGAHREIAAGLWKGLQADKGE